MYARAQNPAPTPPQIPQEKADKTENTPKKPQSTEQSPIQNEPKIAPVNAKTPKYRAARGSRIASSLKPPETEKRCESEPEKECKKEQTASAESCEKPPFDLTHNCENPFFQMLGNNTPKDHQAPSEKCQTPIAPPKKSGLLALFDSYQAGELLVFAILILLIMQSSDDILVLALCFILL